jgi:ribosomal protein S12 methylthiotransferase
MTTERNPSSDKAVYLVNLGCPKNQVDGEVMLGLLAQQGYTLSLDPEQAGVLMVNTCSFINEAKEESIETILDLARYKAVDTHKQLIVTGCLAQRYGQELREMLPEVDVFVGTGEFVRIAEIIEQKRRLLDGPVTYIGAAHVLPDHTVPRIPTTHFYSAYLKVAEGCNHKCAFCIIPKIRGRQESRPIASLVAEAEGLVAQGVKEINLIAQDLTAYGRERRDGTTLLALLKALSTIAGLAWIRLLYCYPNYLDEPLLRFIGEEEKVCSYIDMPLQHISDRMLRRMRREKSGEGIRRLLDRIRIALPGVVLRSSFIVGFPGEQEDDFQQLCDFVTEAGIDNVGVFRYSQEEGTTAGTMPDQVSEEVKEDRWHGLMERQAHVARKKNLARVGKEQAVLVGGQDDQGRWWGRTQGQAPDIDGIVLLENCQADIGEIISARMTGVDGYDMRATCLFQTHTQNPVAPLAIDFIDTSL